MAARTTVCPELGGWLGDFDERAGARAIDDLRRQLDGIAALGGHGVITPAAWGMFTRRLPPFDRAAAHGGAGSRGAARKAWRSSARTPRPAGVVLLLEPLNRYEDHMVNTVAQARRR